jgi:hypothetical protein
MQSDKCHRLPSMNEKMEQHVFAVPFLMPSKNRDFFHVLEQKSHTT